MSKLCTVLVNPVLFFTAQCAVCVSPVLYVSLLLPVQCAMCIRPVLYLLYCQCSMTCT